MRDTYKMVRKKNLHRLVTTRQAMKHLEVEEETIKKLIKDANTSIKAILMAEMNTVPHRNALTRPNVFYKLTKSGKMLKIKS